MRVVDKIGIWALIANFADLVSTIVGLSNFSVIEFNRLYEILGLIPFFMLKVLLPTTVVFLFLFIHEFYKNWHVRCGIEISLVCSGIVFAVATVNNVSVMLSQI